MASPLQTIEQLRQLAEDATWPVSGGTAIVGANAIITAEVDEAQLKMVGLPAVLLNLGDGRPDATDPGLIAQDIALIVLASVEGHTYGSHMVTGGASIKTPRRAYSQGRGVLEVSQGILAALGDLTGADGAPIVVSHSSSARVSMVSGRRIAWQQHVLEVHCTRDDEWPPVQNLVATGGSGQIALTWDLPADRYDRNRIIVRYASGATPPATSNSGTPVTLSGDLATSVTITGLVAGDYSVSAFARYRPINSSDEQDSAAVSRASVTVS